MTYNHRSLTSRTVVARVKCDNQMNKFILVLRCAIFMLRFVSIKIIKYNFHIFGILSKY